MEQETDSVDVTGHAKDYRAWDWFNGSASSTCNQLDEIFIGPCKKCI